jgi:hypothetical protein
VGLPSLTRKKLTNSVLISIPSVLERLDVSGAATGSLIDIESISSHRLDVYDYPRSIRPAVIHVPHLDSIGAFTSGVPESLMNGTKPGVELCHWPRDLATDKNSCKNQYVNLTNASIHLRQTQQVATIIPIDDGRNEGIMEIVNNQKGFFTRIKMPLSIPVTAVLQK